MTCPLLYRFRTIDRLPAPPSSVATRGTLVHAVLERIFDLPPSERSLERAREMLHPEWERLLEEEPELAALFAEDAQGEDLASWMASAAKLLDTYFTLEDPRLLEPAERELYVETTLDDGLVLRGYVDRLDVGRGGELRIVDYKTGTAPPEAFEARALFQMKFYALVLWRTRGVVPHLLQLMYLGSGELLRYVPDAQDLLATERKVLALWQAISRAIEARDFPPRPSKLCEWCDHQSRCPSFGGTPPPYPEPVEISVPITDESLAMIAEV
jgi:putative RecB family exonuclease